VLALDKVWKEIGEGMKKKKKKKKKNEEQTNV
jgi:hypothetical protein